MHRLHLADFIGDINRQRYGPHGPFLRLYLAFRGSKRHTNSFSLFFFTVPLFSLHDNLLNIMDGFLHADQG